MHRNHNWNKTRLLPQTSLNRNVELRLYENRNWCSKYLWRCGQRHQQVWFNEKELLFFYLDYMVWFTLHRQQLRELVILFYCYYYFLLSLLLLVLLLLSLSYFNHLLSLLFFDIFFFLCRGHTVAAVCNSFQLGKDCGFKIVSHMMPD